MIALQKKRTISNSFGIDSIRKNIKKYLFFYLLILPGLVYVIVFSYIPMYGITIAFKEYNISKGILGSPWVGLKHFQILFQESQFYRVILNTVSINIYNIVFGCSFVIFLALMMNELRINALKRVVQTFVYLPNFLSWVVFAGLVAIFLSPSEGPINKIINALGGESIYFLMRPDLFQPVLVVTAIIKGAGFGTIIYLAAIAGINPELYESAIIDGANRGHMMWHITLPRIKPTVAVILILNLAGLFSSNFEQVFTLYSPVVYDTGDVLSTYLYRRGLVSFRFEEATALGMVFNIIGLGTILAANKAISKMDVMGIF
ncbi:MAG: sugar ABC transporter permease [Ruminiclostridium sp.]|nr:sugar ABC transporter permease [Ruminiclostridium sp.]